jgi:hypothetical protein
MTYSRVHLVRRHTHPMSCMNLGEPVWAVAVQDNALKAVSAVAVQDNALKAVSAVAVQDNALKAVSKSDAFKKQASSPKSMSPNKSQAPEWVQKFVKSMAGAQEGSDVAKSFANSIAVAFAALFAKEAHPNAAGISATAAAKLALLEDVFMKMNATPCPDDPSKNIIEATLLDDENQGGLQRFLRPDRGFNVHDTNAFNIILRETQNFHRYWPRNRVENKGTKGMSEVMSLVGLGPDPASQRWSGHNGAFRGPKLTDPDKQPIKFGDRDGCYFKQYIFSTKRIASEIKRMVHYKGAPGQKPLLGKRAIKKLERLAVELSESARKNLVEWQEDE